MRGRKTIFPVSQVKKDCCESKDRQEKLLEGKCCDFVQKVVKDFCRQDNSPALICMFPSTGLTVSKGLFHPIREEHED